ncbi:MAG TPA: hypothetical protein VJP80_03130 [Candidatus Saccharimonadales bacterium]|nr:hypothetical protein [Candidatus Saccharimonadales bacterium]
MSRPHECDAFGDDAPEPERIPFDALEAVDRNLEELSFYAGGVEFGRTTAFRSDLDDHTFLTVETKDRVGTAPSRQLLLSVDCTGGEKASGTFTISRVADDLWQVRGQAETPFDAERELHELAATTDAPDGIRGLAQLVAVHCPIAPFDAELPNLTDGRFRALFETVDAELAEARVPRSYDFKLFTQFNDRPAIVIAHGILPLPDGSRLPESETQLKLNHVIVDGDFAYSRVISMGELYANTIFFPPEPLPPLTDIERAQNPFQIVPIFPDDHAPSLSASHAGEELRSDRLVPCGFQVVSPFADKSDYGTFPSFDEATESAEELYQTRLAVQRHSRSPSEIDIDYVSRMIGRLVDSERKRTT